VTRNARFRPELQNRADLFRQSARDQVNRRNLTAMPHRILVIDRDETTTSSLSRNLGKFGYLVTIAGNPNLGFEQAQNSDFDLVILELELGERNGLELCEILRARRFYAPILVLTLRKDLAHEVLALKAGADDFLAKPFDIVRLAARIEALLRRVDAMQSPQSRAPRLLRIGDMVLDLDHDQLRLNDRTTSLSNLEMKLLVTLAREPDRIFTKEEVLNSVWGTDNLGTDYALTSIIKRLRNKIADTSRDQELVRTIRGLGYKLVVPYVVRKLGH
jgi:DNA-binding response OmpR family regulator